MARLERYVALALEAGIDPVIVLTKADLAEDPAPFVEKAQAISDRVPVLALDARGTQPVEALAGWCKPGRTVAFLGSSGVGKSTLTNALLGAHAVATQGIREDDAKGRHTTTRRELHAVPGGLPRPRHAGHARVAADRRPPRASPTCSTISRRWRDSAAFPTAGTRPSRAAPSARHSRTVVSIPRGWPAGASCRPRTRSTPPLWQSAARKTAPSAKRVRDALRAKSDRER